MAARKKTEAAAEVKTEAAVEAVKAAVEAPAVKAEKKPAEKKATGAKRGPKPRMHPKQTVKIQFGGDEFDTAVMQKAVEKDIKKKYKGAVKTVDVYVKPEDRAVYYVVNNDFSDKVEL